MNETEPKSSKGSASQNPRKWDDPSYWHGVRIGQCVGCYRNGKDVTRHGLCWVCEQQQFVDEAAQ